MTTASREERVRVLTGNAALVFGVGAGVPSDSIQAHVLHSPRSDEVGKVLHDFQRHAFLLRSKLPLVGRMEGKPEGILNVSQQL